MIPAQLLPTGTTPATILALDPNTEYSHGFTLTIANVTANARAWTWYFDPKGTTYGNATMLGPAVSIPGNTVMIVEWPTRIGLGCNGSFAVQTDSASAINFTLGEHGT